MRNPKLYFDLTSQITLLVLLQANCGVFVLDLLLLFPFRDSNNSTCACINKLSLGEFQAVCLLVKDNTATLEQEWSSSILACCYIWRNVWFPSTEPIRSKIWILRPLPPSNITRLTEHFFSIAFKLLKSKSYVSNRSDSAVFDERVPLTFLKVFLAIGA